MGLTFVLMHGVAKGNLASACSLTSSSSIPSRDRGSQVIRRIQESISVMKKECESPNDHRQEPSSSRTAQNLIISSQTSLSRSLSLAPPWGYQ